ncbi:MAG: hypothetical protein WAW37_10405 [Syntrophobacteraceae bacterium]
MTGFSTLRIVILHVGLLVCFSSAAIAEVLDYAVRESAPAEQGKTQSPVVLPAKKKVINVIIDKMENGYIYTKDGRAYQVGGGVRVIDNSKSASKMKIAELVYQGSTLITVTIK